VVVVVVVVVVVGSGCVYNKDQKLSLYVNKVLLLIVKVLLNDGIALHFNSLKYLMFSSVRNL